MAHSQTCKMVRIINNAGVVAKIKADGPNGRIASSGNLVMGESWDFNLRDNSCDGHMIKISADVKGGKDPSPFEVNYYQGFNSVYFVYLTGTIFKTKFESGEVF